MVTMGSYYSFVSTYLTSLQKQVGCFNHRVVALERQWLLEVCFDVED